MYRVLTVILTLGLLAALASSPRIGQVAAQTQPGETMETPAGFESLFSGQDLLMWTALETADPRQTNALSEPQRLALLEKGNAAMNKFWRVEKGEIVNDGEGPYLTTLREFRDFELLIDYKTVAQADSGIYLKATPQVQIWDTTEAGGKWNIGADKGSGGLWNNSPGTAGKDPLKLMDKPFGQWNRFRIIQVGSRTSIWLNGEKVVDNVIMENYWDRKLPLIARGPIQLQTHGGEIRWKNVFVRELTPAESNAFLASQQTEGFDVVFNGQDFSGWKGPVDGYQIENGAIRCREGSGGTIYTEQTYDNYSVRFEFKLPPGGNNGLAIHYPGTGDTAYVGLCELQVLDNEHPKYAKLDPRQYHGSAYGMVPAHRGYLRDSGEWNFQEVTVRGRKLTVELNGTVILDSDLSTVTEFMSGKKHEGFERTSGHFGFAGHNDPVEFRNVAIKKLVK